MKRLFTRMSLVLALTMLVTLAAPVAYAAPANQAQVSKELQPALASLATSGTLGAQVVDAIQSQGTTVAFEDELPDQLPYNISQQEQPGETIYGAYVGYSGGPNVMTINKSLHGADSRTLAALLAHEGTHLRDDRVLGKPFNKPLGCMARELDAFDAEAMYWRTKFPSGKSPTPGENQVAASLEEQANGFSQIHNQTDAANQVANFLVNYELPGHECSLPPASAASTSSDSTSSVAPTSSGIASQQTAANSTEMKTAGDPPSSPQQLPQTGGIPPLVLPALALALLGTGAGLWELARLRATYIHRFGSPPKRF